MVTFDPALPDTANDGDSGHTSDHNSIVAALTALNSGKPDSGDVVLQSLVDAKGDLLVGTANNTVARLAAGTNDHVLTADSSQTAGVKWAAATGGSGIPATTVDAKGDLLVGTADDTVGRLAAGTNGYYLTADSSTSSGLKWSAATESDHLPVFFNVKDYGAVGNGSTDDTVAIQEAVDAVIGSWSSGVSKTPEGVLYFPAGNYLVTEENALFPGTKNPLTGGMLKVRGLHILGDGKSATSITFDPDLSSKPAALTSGNLVTAISGDPAEHPDAVGGATLQEARFEGISFISANEYARFFYGYCWDGRPQSDIKFTACDWRGTWEYAFGLDGPTTTPDADQNSEMSWYNCGTRDDTVFTTAFLYAGMTDNSDLDQQVNYSMIDCSFEYESGDLVRFDRGGMCRVYGGSFILGINDVAETSCSLFRVGSSNTSYGSYVRSLHVLGCRFELRHQNAKILTSKWSSNHAKIVFEGCAQAEDGGAGNPDWAAFELIAGTYGIGCLKIADTHLMDRVLVTDSGGYANDYGHIIFDNVTFQNYPTGGVTPDTGTSVGAVTASASTNYITCNGHGLVNGDVVAFTSITNMAGITSGEKYTVRDKTTDTFKVRLNNGSAFSPAVDITSDGSATCTKFGLVQRSGSADPVIVYRDCVEIA